MHDVQPLSSVEFVMPDKLILPRSGGYCVQRMAMNPLLHGKKSMGAITILRLTRRNSIENNTDS